MAALARSLGLQANGKGQLFLWLSLLVLLALYPYTGVSRLTLFVGSQIFVLVSLASNWNLIGGMTGYVDFGHAVFFRIGAYVMGILVTPSPTDLSKVELLAGFASLRWSRCRLCLSHRPAHAAPQGPLFSHCYAG